MPFTTLSSVVQAHPSAIDSTLEKLSCSACGIDDIDIYPAALSALTAKGAPRSVADEVRAVVSVARQTRPRAARGDAAPPRSLKAHNFLASSSSATARSGAGDKEDASYLDNFNVGIAMSLHTVLLSRNRIASLLGIVQFRHCVRLSLLSNRIRTIEDCEPLALLPDLQYLSLEFNPVAHLPHYRAHLLRICAWPHELSVRTCRLRKLDSLAVNSAEVKRAVVCLRRELTLMPELLSRMQLLAFLGDVEKKHAVHRELRQRGVLLQQTTEKATLQSTLERGAAYALDRVPVSGAAHLVRLLVRDRHRLAASAQSTVNATTLSSCPSLAPQPGADASATTITFFGSDDLDTSKITSVSDIASCSLLSDEDVAAAEDARVLKSLSTLLGSKELSRSHPALLRRADAVDARETCKQWSHDAFRQTLSLLDVRVCAALLRLSRTLGTTLDAHEVDRLCQVWLHAVTHCAPASSSGGRSQYNATGPRRIVTTAAVGGKAASVPMAQTQGVSSPAQRLPVETVAPVHQNVWAIGDADGCLSSTSSSSVCSIAAAVPAVSSDVTNACADISMTSLSSDSLLVPRETAPLPTAAASRPTTKGATPLTVSIAQANPEAQQHVPLPSTKFNELTLKQREQGALSLQLSMADTAYRQRSRQRVFQQWCTSLRHRWQTRIAAAYVRDKIDEATQHRCRPALRSPSWSGLITHVTYLERKRGFFNCWRGRTEERRAGRAVACGAGAASEASSSPCVLGGAPSLCVQPPLQQRPLIAEEPSSVGTQHSTKRAVFNAWKAKAEAQALSRCTVARARVRAESPQTPETFLTLHTRSLVARRGQSATSALPSPDAARQLLADLLSTGEKRTAVATSPPLLGFRRCMLAEDSPIKVTTWQSSAQTHAVSVKSASSLANEEGLSPVAPSSSDGISMNSITTPFLPGAPPTPSPPRAASPTAQESRSSSPVARCVATGGQPRHEPSPPPAIRILFPVKYGAPAVPTPPLASPPHVPAVTAAVAVAASCGRSAARLYGGTQPSRLPSTTAARRAIRISQSSPKQTATDSAAAPPASVLPEQMHRSSPSAASPYPVEDVEALVTRSRQLEADRIFLLSEVRKLSTERGRQPAVTLHCGLHPTFDVSSHDGAEERCVAQEREIKRLEAIVAALRDERRGLLSAVSPDIFRY